MKLGIDPFANIENDEIVFAPNFVSKKKKKITIVPAIILLKSISLFHIISVILVQVGYRINHLHKK